MTAPEPQRVAIFCKPAAPATAVLQRVVDVLERHGIEMLPDENTTRALGNHAEPVLRSVAARQASLVVSVGGDGTLLSSARAVGATGVPILGVNLGSLGFLTETRCEEVAEVLVSALEGRAVLEDRSVLQVWRDGDTGTPDGIALNDVVFSNQQMARLISLSLIVDGEWVTDYRADGLILATPTGSTAYNLAAGGPLVMPGVDALLATPICPHSLSQRPLILPRRARVTVRLPETGPTDQVQVTLDGQVGFPLTQGGHVDVAVAPYTVRLVRPAGRSFFSTLRNKLGWGHP